MKALFETTSFVVGPADNFDVPGYLVIRPERTVSGFDELRPQELAEFGILQGAYRIIQRRAKDANIETKIGNHTFRATGITAYLKNAGKLAS